MNNVSYEFPESRHAVCPAPASARLTAARWKSPIVQSTTFCKGSIANQADARLFPRVSNPTVRRWKRPWANWKTPRRRSAFSTGLAAETALFLRLCAAGDHVICGRPSTAERRDCWSRCFRDLGIVTTFVDATRHDAVQAAIRRRTRLVFVETPSNPTLEVTDIAAVAAVAHRAGVLLAVDNTFMTRGPPKALRLRRRSVGLFDDEVHRRPLGRARRGSGLPRRESAGAAAVHPQIDRRNSNALRRLAHLAGLQTLPLRIRRQSETAAEVAQLARRPARDHGETYYPTLGSVGHQAPWPRSNTSRLSRRGRLVSSRTATSRRRNGLSEPPAVLPPGRARRRPRNAGHPPGLHDPRRRFRPGPRRRGGITDGLGPRVGRTGGRRGDYRRSGAGDRRATSREPSDERRADVCSSR